VLDVFVFLFEVMGWLGKSHFIQAAILKITSLQNKCAGDNTSLASFPFDILFHLSGWLLGMLLDG